MGEAKAMDAQAQLDTFIDRFTPDIAILARALIARLKARIPGATILVYDYYNALAIGWAPDDKTRHGILSLALYPRWVNLCFLRGADLPDPHGLLAGTGSQARTIRIAGETQLDDARVDALIAEALHRSEPPVDPTAAGALIIKGISPRQRARRP